MRLTEVLTQRIPKEWNSAPLRYVSEILNGGTPSGDAENWDGDIPFITPADLRDYPGQTVRESARFVTRLGAARGSTVSDHGVVISNRAPIGYVSVLSGLSAFNQGCKVVRPRDLHERFLTYVLMAAIPALQALGQGTTFMEISRESLASLRIPIPPTGGQRAIADFLDRETAKIDALIEKQTTLIDRLRERRRSVIDLVATQGLPGQNSLIPAASAYLDQVPENWVESHFGLEMMINGGLVDPSDEPWLDMILIAPNHVESDTGRIVQYETATEQGADSGKYLVRKGQLIYSKIRPALNKVTVADRDCLCSADMYGLTSRKRDNHRYLMYFMLSRPFHSFASVTSARVKMPKINREELGSAPWPRPPQEEQHQIVEYLDTATSRIDTVISAAERHIELARERRAALITAAVTGQIDVSKGAA